MIKRLITFGDSFTEGEGAWLEKTEEIEKQYEDSSVGRLKVAEFNYKYSWPKVLGDRLGVGVSNLGSCGASNNYIFNSIFEFDKKYDINDNCLVVVMWSSSIRDKLPFFPTIFQNHSPVGLGWSLKEIFATQTIENQEITNFTKRFYQDDKDKEYIDKNLIPFMSEYFKPFITQVYDKEYYNLLNFSYVHFLESFFKFKGCDYIFIDAFESMNSFGTDDKKWDIIGKDKYWKFGKTTAWDYLNVLGGDVFENLKLSYNPPGQKCHPNRHGYKIIADLLYDFYKKSLSP